ncbi:DUF1902 domain-containing protein [Salinarimonas chemoclinalis]|uniref:DUF1902 domain-containing protein n=1 Tax=Salinarimonas chemoclinalis TaxID=3241599 RepID=UPI003558C647
MASRLVLVKAVFDDEADVWYVEHSSLPGLAAEATSLDALIARLPGMVADLIEENGFEGGAVEEVALEVVASHGQRVALRDVA